MRYNIEYVDGLLAQTLSKLEEEEEKDHHEQQQLEEEEQDTQEQQQLRRQHNDMFPPVHCRILRNILSVKRAIQSHRNPHG